MRRDENLRQDDAGLIHKREVLITCERRFADEQKTAHRRNHTQILELHLHSPR